MALDSECEMEMLPEAENKEAIEMKRRAYPLFLVSIIVVGLIAGPFSSYVFTAKTAVAQEQKKKTEENKQGKVANEDEVEREGVEEEGIIPEEEDITKERDRLREDEITPREVVGPDGALMALIPAGEFLMGSDKGKADERPVHSVYLRDFYMDKYEVTNALYREFLNANIQWRKDVIAPEYHDGRYLHNWDGNDPPPDEWNHPVTYVSWHAARAYALWAEKRLPMESEWEKAARGGLVGKKYPWGDDISHRNANYSGTERRDQWEKTAPGGSFPPNGYGLYDMAGNVAEWCLNSYDRTSYGKALHGSPRPAMLPSQLIRVAVRGGSWQGSPIYAAGAPPSSLRVAHRECCLPKSCLGNVGFRCVVYR
jgi:formylglycine-generating enzyme required for sulfatase activity